VSSNHQQCKVARFSRLDTPYALAWFPVVSECTLFDLNALLTRFRCRKRVVAGRAGGSEHKAKFLGSDIFGRLSGDAV
jgi:hypothetical protein